MSYPQIVTSTVASLESPVKMEPDRPIRLESDRKRSAAQNVDDLAPPTKRQAVNGTGKSSKNDDAMPWNNELELYQKDAILREMHGFKREKTSLEGQLNEIRKKVVHHDDHIRVIDAWWSQLLDEILILSNNGIPSSKSEASFCTRFANNATFQSHLDKKGKHFKEKVSTVIENLAAGIPKSEPELQDAKKEIIRLLGEQKIYMIEVDKLRVENESLTERLEDATLRYFKAEKARDRMRSQQVAALETKALIKDRGGKTDSTQENGSDSHATTNGVKSDDAEVAATQLAYKEASAVIAKQKEQIDDLAARNKSITEDLTAASAKLAGLNDDDYSRTELFKNLKNQHEEVIKRVNHLEITNIQLREEAERLQAERTTHRNALENESEAINADTEARLQRTEEDLTRIRSARDELFAENALLKSCRDQHFTSVTQLTSLVEGKDDRITSLEHEVQRLRAQTQSLNHEPAQISDIEDLGLEELRQKYVALDQSFQSINIELPAMEKAYKKTAAAATRKVTDHAAAETKMSMLLQEKAKADQKYFAARKDADVREQEIKQLRAQNAKSVDMVSQLKLIEATNRTLLTNVEKQLSEVRQSNISSVTEQKKLELSNADLSTQVEVLKSQVSELTELSKSKDAGSASATQMILSLENNLQQIKVKNVALSKEKDTLKANKGSSTEQQALWHIAICNVCNTNFKDTALKVCGHTFCGTCIDERLTSRLRKCPTCNKPFDKFDKLEIYTSA